MGTRVVLAGMEDIEMLQFAKGMGARHVLLSYWYLRSRKNNWATYKALFEAFELVIIDSGAFTLFNKVISQYEFDAYIDNYAEFLTEFKDYISIAAELDLYKANHLTHKVEQARMKLEDTGATIMPLYHGKNSNGHQDLKWLEDVVSAYKYIGVGSGLTNANFAHMNKVFSIARKAGCAVHGMGVTSLNALMRSYYYSADSTSWSMGAQFGITYEMRGSTLKTWDKMYKDAVRKRNLPKYEAAGLDKYKILADDGKEVNKLNLLEWNKFIDRVQFKVRDKDYVSGNPANQSKRGKQVSQITTVAGSVPFDEILKLPVGSSFTFETDFDSFSAKVLSSNADSVTVECIESGKEHDADYYLEKRVLKKEEVENLIFSVKQEKVMAKARASVSEAVEAAEITSPSGEVVSEGETLPTTVPDETGLISVTEGALSMLQCASCYAGDRCPHYHEGNTCTLRFKSDIKGKNEFAKAMHELVASEMERLQRAMFFEKMDGGVLDKSVSDEMKNMTALLTAFKDLADNRDEVIIKAKGSGILAQMFGAKKKGG